MANQKASILDDGSDEYEILPHKELHELRDQLMRLKERPTEKTMQLAMAELVAKMDRLISIFDESLTMIKVDEGSLSFTEKLRPLMEKLDKVLEQNSEIAQGIVELHDGIIDIKESLEKRKDDKFSFEPSPLAMTGPAIPAPGSAGRPIPPPPSRR